MNRALGRCIILAAGERGCITKEQVAPGPDDYVICCDAGYLLAVELDIVPSLVVGDFDSFDGEIPYHIPVHRVGAVKDDTDSMLAIKLGLEMGYRDFLLVAVTGGRLDHTIANLQSLHYIHQHGGTGYVLGAYEEAFLLHAGESATLPRREGYTLSVFSYGEEATGVCETGVYYPLDNATLTNGFSLGVSNQIVEEVANISVANGILLVLQCRIM